MKKMQCETCGSTDIKKINDDVFECQSCGVQYSSEEAKSLLVEITGTVKIDHSDEVDNALKRAEQFVNDGDTTKAEEYYNKALDLDAENKKANEEIKKIKKEKALPQNIFLLEKDIDGTKSITRFLKCLKEQNNIAPDIYKEIEIISTTEQYFPFLVIGGTYQGSYSGTACYRKEVEYTEWEDYTDYVNGKPVKRRRPVTKTRIDYDKEHSSGTYTAECREIFSISSTFNSLFTNYQASKFDQSVLSNKGSLKAANSSIIKALETDLNNLYDSYYEKTIQFKPDTIPTDLPVDAIPGDKKSWSKRADAQYNKSVESACYTRARICVGGDKNENISFDWGSTFEAINYIYIPIQVIEYSYKGDMYFAANILSTKCDDSSFVYPYYKKVDGIIEEGDKNINNMRPKGGYGAWAWTIGVFALFIGWYFGKNTYLFRDVFMALAYTNFGLGAFLTIVGLINLVKTNKIKNSYIKEISDLSAINKEALNKGYKLFFDNYTGIDSISKCNDIVEKSCDFSCSISEITYEINGTEDDVYDSEDFEEEQDEDEYDEED